jgi:hypothetical protein
LIPLHSFDHLAHCFFLCFFLQASIPSDLLAKDSFSTGSRVWEVKIPISALAAIPGKCFCQRKMRERVESHRILIRPISLIGDTIYVSGGINYARSIHWYPDYMPTSGWTQYAPVKLASGGMQMFDSSNRQHLLTHFLSNSR